ncbi:MAG: hypothetical protein PGN37_14345 [Mycobacterium kyogaense]|uniref:hypothetical protein n=1 Tax=Mycobacterium kyogaense TaxID=2212479 RepID=UPI002FF623C1
MDKNTHIGRVGALAVALGIGFAIVAIPGEAWAAPDDTSSASVSTGPSVRSAADDAADKPARRGLFTKRAESTSDDAASTEKTRNSVATKRKRAAVTEPRDDVDESRTVADDAPDVEPPDAVSAPQQPTQVTRPTKRVTTESDTATVEEPDEPARPLATALTTLFTPKLTPPSTDPAAPSTTAPLLWTMLASARRQSVEASSKAATASSVIAARDVAAAGTSAIPGQAYQSPVIATDGTIYQVTTAAGRVRVFVLDKDAQVLADTGDIVGNVRGGAVTRPDGTLVLITANERGTRSTISTVDSSGTVTTVRTITGSPTGQVRVGADGALYFATRLPQPFDMLGATYPYRYYRISPTNSAQTLPYTTSLGLEDDGTAYLVSSQFGSSTLRVYTPSGATRTIGLPYGSTPSAPILGQDGTVYVLASQRTLFGAKTTRVYALDGTTSTARTVNGLPGATVVTADGLYLETFTYPGTTDNGAGTTYISKITTTGAQTSDPITGRVAGFTFQVTPDGTVYAPITDPSLNTGAVAIVAADGSVTTTTLPGPLVTRTVRTSGGATTGSENVGYVNYRAGGIDHVAVINPDGSIVRTIDLPAGASASTVFFGPDGAAYQLLDYPDPNSGQTTAHQAIALGTGTLTQVVPGNTAQGSFGVQFGPDGVGYFFTGTPNSTITKIVGFDSAGNTVVPLSTFQQPVDTLTPTGDYRLLSFDPNGTAYLLDYTVASSAGVYALTSTGAQLVAPIDRAGGVSATAPVFTDDGTGFVTIADPIGNTLVISFPAVSTV